MLPFRSASLRSRASSPAHTRPCAMESTYSWSSPRPSATMEVNCPYIFSTDACRYAVSLPVSGRRQEYMSLCSLEFTAVAFIWAMLSSVLLKSGIMLNTPMEPVRVLLFVKI